MSNIPFYLEAISAALYSGQKSETKRTGQAAFESLRRALERDGLSTADAQALADVRTLDDWAGQIQSRFWAVKTVNESPCCCLWALDVRELAVCVRVGTTPDEARAKAAAWVRGLPGC